jgi:hypothetical protein
MQSFSRGWTWPKLWLVLRLRLIYLSQVIVFMSVLLVHPHYAFKALSFSSEGCECSTVSGLSNLDVWYIPSTLRYQVLSSAVNLRVSGVEWFLRQISVYHLVLRATVAPTTSTRRSCLSVFSRVNATKLWVCFTCPVPSWGWYISSVHREKWLLLIIWL